MRILLLDIETAPNTAFVWNIWQENIPLAMLTESSYMLCYCAKWLGEDEVFFASTHKMSTKKMLKGIHKLLDEADAVIHYNGARFDIPVLNKEFLLSGILPPSPYKQVDLYKTVKSKFKFVSNKLDYVVEALGIGKKKETNFKLWVDCMKNDPVAWKTMEDYNKHDVVLLEGLYDVLLPWITNHPNVGAYQDDKQVCPNCGGQHFQKRGYSTATLVQYQRYRCNDCGTWFRSTTPIQVKGEKFVNAK
jgi:predicted RNA-binding Zn-ribbon protein involved in translation (DUF1610 family)